MPEEPRHPRPEPRRSGGSGRPRGRKSRDAASGRRRATPPSSGQDPARTATDKQGRAPGGRSSGDAPRPRRRRNPHHQRAHVFRPFTPGQLAARAAAIPVISYPDLPVSDRRHDIAEAIRDNQVVIVSGETGSGKTTQLPKICLQLGRGVAGMIGHTQPRRIAARAVADRIAEELGQKVGRAPGQVIGYQVRFTDEVGPTTLVKLMTDGILLAEIQSDPLLRRYDTLIIDEAHERSLNIDFILGYIARLLPLRPDLKVVITSATIDSQRFAAHFGRWEGRREHSRLLAAAPVIEVSGRTYPVEIRYRPLSADLPSTWSSSTPTPASAKSAQFPPRSPSSPAVRPTSTGRGTDGATTATGRDAAGSTSGSVYEGDAASGPGTGQRAGADGPGSEGGPDLDGTGATRPGVQQLVLEDPDDDLPTLGYGLGEDIDQEQAICDAVDELCAEGPGDILVFLPGERDIRDTQQALADHLGPRALTDPKAPHRPDAIEIVPLFARLTAAEQHRVFEPHTLRRVVLATNVAETSLTVPGVRYVIDPGLARISRYSNRTKVQRLPIEPISRASANQRAGRSGRVADGVAIRLYSQRDYESRPEFTEPEILRTSLASVILQMAALGLGAVSDFPFLDPPEPRAVRDGIQLLVEIGALEPDDAATPPSSAGTDAATAGHDRRGGRDTGARGRTPGPEQGGPHGQKGADFEPRTERTSSPERSGLRRSGGHRLTAIGRDLATLPIDPRLGRMLIEGDANGCASEVLVIVAALSIQDVRERPLDHQQAADASHARFTDPTSDFITYLNLWRYLNVQSRDLSGSAFRRMCRGEFLHYLRFREWRDVVNQLRQMARPLDLDIHPIGEPTPAQVAHAAASGGIADAAARAVVAYTASSGTVDADEVHRALLVGLLSNLGNWDEAKRDYAGARGTHFTIWPGSGLARSHPAWVMTAELVETSRLFARTVARIRPEWIEPLAGPLLRHVYSEPYWSTSRGAAMVKEKVLLYGMTLVADRPVLLGRLDVTFGGGGARRSSVARPGTLAGMAQGLRARGRGEREVGESTALADALSEALATFGVQEADEGGGSAREGGTAASDTTTGPTAPAGASDSRRPGTTTAPSHDPTAEGAALVDDAHAQADPTGGAPEDEARSSRVAETGTGAETSTGPDSRAEPLADAEPVADAEPAGDPGITARELAREMFIRHALVLGEWREHHRFTDRNQELLDDAREAERRSRTHGLVADEEARFAFFDDLVPEGIVSARHFDQWWKHQRRETPDLLTYTPQMLLPRGTGTDAGDFPDHWEQGDLRLPLEYRFTPGSSRDGVTMTVPVEVLPRVSEDGTDWLVPGMLEDLCTETVRALPKAKRRLLAPAPEVGGKVAAWLRRALADGGPVPEGSTQGVAGAPGSPDTPDGPAGSDTRSASGARPGAADEGAPARTRTERTADGAIGTGTRGGTGEDPRSLDAALGRLAAWTRTSGQNATVDPSRLGKSRSGTTGSASRPATGADTVGRRRTPGSTDTTAPTGAATGAGADGTGSGAGETSGGAPSWAAHRPPFARAFARAVSEVRGIDLSDSDLAHARAGLPEHLRMTFVVQDSSGRELGSGPSLVHLQRTLASQAEKAVRTAVRGAVAEAFAEAARRDGHSTRKGGAQGTGTDHSHHSGAAASAGTPPSSTGADLAGSVGRTSGPEQSGLRGRNRADLGAGTERTSAEGEGVRGELHADDLVEFPEVPLPRSVESRGAGGMLLRGFPALVPQGDASEPRAGVRVMASPAEADRQHRLGLARLLLARVRLSPTRVTTRWTGREALMLAASPYGDTTSLVADAQLASALSLVDELSGEQGPATVRSRTSFDALATRARDLHEDRVHDILGHVVRAMGGLAEVQGLMRDHPEPSLREVVGEVEDQVRALVHPGFLADTPHWALPHLARYLRAGAVRIDKASRGARALSRDARDAQVVRDVSEEVDSARERAAGRPYEPVEAQRLERAWWLVQELRVSLFAQQLGTPQKVSAKRILGMVDR